MTDRILGVMPVAGQVICGSFDIDGVTIPLLLAAGKKAGPMLAVHCAQHPREFSGSAMIGLLLRELDLAALAGVLAIVPLCNMPFIRRERLPDSHQAIADSLAALPKERANPNRNWPGRPDGAWIDKLTYRLSHELFARAAAVLDYHSCRLCDPNFAAYVAGDQAGRQLALATGFGWVSEDPFEGPMHGQLHRHVPREIGTPSILIEMAPSHEATSWDAVQQARRATLNALKHLGMLPGRPVLPPRQVVSHRFSEQHSLQAGQVGFACMYQPPGVLVGKGELIAEVRSLADFAVLERHVAPADGGLCSAGPPRSHLVLAGEELATLQPGVETIDNR